MTETKTDVVLYDAADGVATITLNRPDRLNAWTPELGTAYFDALERAAADGDVRVIVVTGAGKGFCAGADMEVLQGGAQGERDPRPQRHPLTIPKPIVAAINGACAGLGMAMALMCDIRFASASAKFTTAFSRRGLIAEHGMSWMLPRLTGPAVALDLLFSGRVFLGDEAAELGVVNKALEPDALMGHVMSWAKDTAQNASSISMQVMKREVYEHLERDLAPAMDEADRLMGESLQRPDFREGVQSFLEKRPPNFEPVSWEPES